MSNRPVTSRTPRVVGALGAVLKRGWGPCGALRWGCLWRGRVLLYRARVVLPSRAASNNQSACSFHLVHGGEVVSGVFFIPAGHPDQAAALFAPWVFSIFFAGFPFRLGFSSLYQSTSGFAIAQG